LLDFPLLSVLELKYNYYEKNHLASECIEGALCQKYAHYEIMLVRCARRKSEPEL
jgi:hypothetical protein